MTVEPPGERAEPENCAMQQRKALGESVAAGDVGDFVGDDGVELGVVPFAPGGGQQNGGAQRAHGDRNGNQFGFGGLRDRRPCPRRGRARRVFVVRRGSSIVVRLAQQAAAEREADEEAREQKEATAR